VAVQLALLYVERDVEGGMDSVERLEFDTLPREDGTLYLYDDVLHRDLKAT
jgi:hypothetical protein